MRRDRWVAGQARNPDRGLPRSAATRLWSESCTGTLDLSDSTNRPEDPDSGDPVDNAYLLVFEGMSSKVFSLELNGSVVIGRGTDAHVQLRDSVISRAHARIAMVSGEATIEDLGSQHGTKVNGERIVAARPLMSGDVIGIHEAILVFYASSRKAAPHELVLDPRAERRERQQLARRRLARRRVEHQDRLVDPDHVA
jgi:pSer/pThr/pTyr-binding forkhead associated (FHA) protein